MALLVAAAFFGVFAINVALGAMSGTAFLSDVTEMLVLLATSVFFVAGVLRHEARGKKKAVLSPDE